MPFRENITPGFAPLIEEPIKKPIPPTGGETFEAAMKLENDVLNFIDLVNRPQYDDDVSFDLGETVKKSPYWENHRNRFLGVGSQPEYDAIAGRIEEETRARDILAAAGIPGVLAAIAAGVMSPTVLLPLTHGARGARAVYQGAKLGAVAVGGQELVLAAAQETRAPTEIGINVGSGVVIGGILGGAVGFLSKGARAKAGYDLAFRPDGTVLDKVGVQGTDGARINIVPISGRFRYIDENGDLIEFTPERMLAVTPDSKEVLEELIGGSLTKSNLQKFAKEQGYDAISIQGFDPSDLIAEMGQLQRGVAESAMLRVQRTTGGSILNDVVEHSGDLQHRVSELKFGVDEMYRNFRDKVLRVNRSLTQGYGFEREFTENLRNNAVHRGEDFRTLRGDVTAKLKKFAEAHADLPVYNDLHRLIRKANVAIGKQKWETARIHYKKLVEIAEDKDKFSKMAQEVDDSVKVFGDELLVLDKSKFKNLGQDASADVSKGLPKFGSGVEQVLVPRTAPEAVGAAATRGKSAGGLKQARVPGTRKLTRALAFIGPVTRVIQQEVSAQGRWMMAQLSTAGLRLEGNIRGVASAVGGTVEDNIQVHFGKIAVTTDKVDQLYADYIFGKGQGGFGRSTRAAIQGLVKLGEGKVSKAEFRKEISRAHRGQETDIPEAAAAADFIEENLYKPLWDEWLKVNGKLIDEDVELVGDTRYLNRQFNNDAIDRDFDGFVIVLAKHFNRQMQDDFIKALDKLNLASERDIQLIEDLGRSLDEAEELKAIFVKELEDLEKGRNVDLLRLEDEIAAERKAARGDNLSREEKGVLLGRARDLTEQGGEELKRLKQGRTGLRRRIRNLNRNRFILEEKAFRKLEKIERSEELNLNALKRVIRVGERTKAELTKFSDEKLSAAITRLRKLFEDTSGIHSRGQDQIMRLYAEDETGLKVFLKEEEILEKIAGKEELQLSRLNRMENAAKRLEDAEEIGASRELLREIIDEGLDDALEGINKTMRRRAIRGEKLREQAKKLDPKLVDEYIVKIGARIPQRQSDLVESLRVAGAEDVDLERGLVDFSAHAREDAETVANHILGTNNRIAGMNILLEKRGPELARRLNIPSEEMEKWLENDIERLIRAYVRTLAPDIEITRKLGSPNGALEFQRLTEEMNAAKRGKTDAEQAKIDDVYKGVYRDLIAVMERARFQRGVPANPRGMATRLGRLALNLNTLRFMGSVTIASIPDLGRPVQKYGLVRAFRDSYIPFIRGLKEMKLIAREIRLAGGALDPIMHSRAQQLFDLLDETKFGTKAEKGIEHLTNRMGLIALFDYWTAGLKTLSGAVTNAKLLDSVDLLMNGQGTAKELAEATEFLASRGIDGELADQIWREVIAGGGGNKVNGVWLPNTESWENPTAVRAYRAALVGDINNTIITPGFERPLWTDQNLGGRLVGQFKSFAFSSTTKTMMAGLQQGDAAFVTGTMISLGLGTLSYYLWAMSVGGRAMEEMLDADVDKWADEAIQRSGNLAVFSEAQRILERVPLTQPFVSFSGQRSTRRAGGDLTEALLGPTFDLANRASGVLMDLDDPTQSTAHKVRTITPLQNIFYLRRAFDAIEAVGADALDLPERR